MRKILMMAGAMFLCGCSTTGGIDQSFRRLELQDGVSKRESSIIAQKFINDSAYRYFFTVGMPQHVSIKDLKDYNTEHLQQHWAVYFPAKFPSKDAESIPDDVQSAIEDHSFIYSAYLLFVNKVTGSVDASGVFVLKASGKMAPVAPPGQQSQSKDHPGASFTSRSVPVNRIPGQPDSPM